MLSQHYLYPMFPPTLPTLCPVFIGTDFMALSLPHVSTKTTYTLPSVHCYWFFSKKALRHFTNKHTRPYTHAQTGQWPWEWCIAYVFYIFYQHGFLSFAACIVVHGSFNSFAIIADSTLGALTSPGAPLIAQVQSPDSKSTLYEFSQMIFLYTSSIINASEHEDSRFLQKLEWIHLGSMIHSPSMIHSLLSKLGATNDRM